MNTQTPITIPDRVLTLARKLRAKLGREAPWWFQEVPASGIPIRFNGRGVIRAGVAGWIVNGHARTVFLGEAAHRTEVGEFVAVTEYGSQVLGQVGRDFDFVETL